MVDTYAEARAIVDRELRPQWGDTAGTFYVDEQGFEDDTSYFVPWGAREWLVENDPSYVLINGAATFVDKATGAVVLEPMVACLERVDRMAPAR